jgi:hypothetical protein
MDEFDGLLASARKAYARGDWHAAYRQLSQARALSELETGDLSLLGRAAWWLGYVKESLEVSEDVYHRSQDDGDASDAAMKALHLGLLWFIRGDVVIASGWVSRARGLLQGLPEVGCGAAAAQVCQAGEHQSEGSECGDAQAPAQVLQLGRSLPRRTQVRETRREAGIQVEQIAVLRTNSADHCYQPGPRLSTRKASLIP